VHYFVCWLHDRSVLFIREPKHLSSLKYFTVNKFQVRHARFIDRITSIVKLSQTQLSIFILLKGVFYTNTCFGLYIAHHQGGYGVTPPPPISQPPTCYNVYTFYIRITFNSTATVIILIANFRDLNEISFTKTKTLFIV